MSSWSDILTTAKKGLVLYLSLLYESLTYTLYLVYSFLYTASEAELVITPENDTYTNITSADGVSYIAGTVCTLDVS